jgi:L-2-hydroxycarboxylate dehydrogenase (NAD+)
MADDTGGVGTDDTVTIDRDRAERVAAAAFEAHGIRPADAETTARVLVSADARGKPSHGLLRLPRFVRGIEHGNVADGEIEVVRDWGAAATIDGGARLGPVVATEAIDTATDRASEFGIGAVAVRNANHLGMLGYYTDRARRDGYVALGTTNTEPAMPPYGGAEPILGTNPVAIAAPTEPPFNLDMSTSSIARGDVLRAKERGESLPEGVALDADGEPTTDPDAALEGVIRPFGGPKGSGLAIAVELLAGGLAGAAMGDDVTGTYHTEDPCTKGDLFVAIDPDATGDGFVDRASRFVDALRRVEPAAGSDGVRLPGEDSIGRGRAGAVTIDAAVWDEVRDLADETGT